MLFNKVLRAGRKKLRSIQPPQAEEEMLLSFMLRTG